MAENKNSFILYVDTVAEIIKELPREIKGDLFQLIVDYVKDLDPEPTDILLKTAFAPIKMQLKRDLVKWEVIRQKRSIAGKASADKKQHMLTHVESVEQMATNSTVNVNVNDNVNVNVNEESNTPAIDITKSNLFRQPKIPTLEEVHRAFLDSGGTKEMADIFFNNNQSTGWFLRGSPITNFKNLLPSFISNWTKNEKNAKPTGANQRSNDSANGFLERAKARHDAAFGGAANAG